MKEDKVTKLLNILFQLYDILEEPKLCRQLKDQQLPGVYGETGINRWNTEKFQSSETILYTLMVIQVIKHLTKAIEGTTHYKLWTLVGNGLSLVTNVPLW